MARTIHILYTLLLTLLLNGAIAHDLSDYFITFPGGRDVGGCDADISRLQQAYTEAYDLLGNAQTSLESLGKQRPHYTQDAVKLSSSDKRDVQEWDRQARLAKTLFAIDVDPAKGITDPSSVRRFGAVQSKFSWTLWK